jgi:5-methylcytosine-specific restriction enzyme A
VQLNSKEKIAYRRTKEWKAKRQAVLERDEFVCKICNKKNKSKNLQIHHINESKYKDSDEINFLVTLCKACHQEVERWVRKLNSKTYRSNKYTELMRLIVKDFTVEVK